MRHINTHQVDSMLWVLEVTDGYQTEWTASFNSNQSNLLEIRYGDRKHGKVDGSVILNGRTESDRLGDAMGLVYNWAQFGPQCNELLNNRWTVRNESLIHHFVNC